MLQGEMITCSYLKRKSIYAMCPRRFHSNVCVGLYKGSPDPHRGTAIRLPSAIAGNCSSAQNWLSGVNGVAGVGVAFMHSMPL